MDEKFQNLEFTKEEYESFLNVLADIYVQNFGISITHRTLAHNFAISLIENYTKMDFDDAVAFFDTVLDAIKVDHRNYDICFIDDAQMDLDSSVMLYEDFGTLYKKKMYLRLPL